MKVLLLAQFYPPVIGGEERHVLNLARELAGRGHEVHVATLDTGAVPQHDDGVTVHVLGNVGKHVPALYPTADRPLALPLPDPITTRDLARVAREVGPDVVHAHNWIINSWIALPAARRLPLVYSLHDYSHHCPTKRLMYHDDVCSGPAFSKCFECVSGHYGKGRGQVIQAAVRGGEPVRRRLVDVFTPVSRFVGEANGLEEQGVRWQVVPNFVPDALTSLPELPRDPDLPAGDFFFFAGDISDQKGVPALLEGYAALDPATRPGLMLVGNPTLDLSSLPDGVVAGHHWTHDRVLSGFQHCLAAVLPSRWPDPCPTTVLEAMAVGAPLVTTHQGGIADMVVDEESALVVAPGESAPITAALQRMATDADLRKRLSAQASVEVQRYLQSRVAEDFEQIYLSLL